MEVVLVRNIPTSPLYTLLMSKKCMQFIHDSLPIFKNLIRDFQSIFQELDQGLPIYRHLIPTLHATIWCIKNPKKYFAKVKFPQPILVETRLYFLITSKILMISRAPNPIVLFEYCITKRENLIQLYLLCVIVMRLEGDQKAIF